MKEQPKLFYDQEAACMIYTDKTLPKSQNNNKCGASTSKSVWITLLHVK